MRVSARTRLDPCRAGAIGAGWHVRLLVPLAMLALALAGGGCASAATSQGARPARVRDTGLFPQVRPAMLLGLRPGASHPMPVRTRPRVRTGGAGGGPAPESTTSTTGLPPPITTPPVPGPPPPAAPGLVAGRVTVVGDSVTIDAAPALEATIPGVQVDAQVGEQWETGVSVLAGLRAEGQLGSVVVVALGTNGPVSVGEFQQMMSVLQRVSRVVIVTNHGPASDSWMEQNNAMFDSEVPHYANARIANWDAVAAANPGWFGADGVHMVIGGPGAYAWANLVKEQI